MKHDIGVDIRMMRNTGIGTYLQNIVPRMLKNPGRGHSFCLYGNSGFLEAGEKVEAFEAPIYSLREQWEYPGLLKQCRLWHAPHYNIPFLKGTTKLVVTIHDLIHWIFRDPVKAPLKAFYAGSMFSRVVQTADHIITVSENTKKDFIRHFSADPQKISVIYEAAVSPPFQSPEPPVEIHKKYGLQPRYFLYVGMIKPHKNVKWLVRLFRENYRKKGIRSPLVIVGKLDTADREAVHLFSNLTAEDGILHLSNVDKSDLSLLYSHSIALVHPSLYEGFGLTLLEAMACGTPVIAFKTSSIPEVAGDGAYLIDSSDSDQLIQALKNFEGSEALRAEWIRKGKMNVQRFDWNRTAEKTLGVYERVLASR